MKTSYEAPPLSDTKFRIKDTTLIRVNDTAKERGVSRNIVVEKAIEFYLDRLPSIDIILEAHDRVPPPTEG
jgi:hypothetical protein